MALAEGVYKDAAGLCDADGVGYLHHHLVCHACGHHILGDIARCIGAAAVHLAGVLAGECAAAVGAAAAVGVHYDLAAGKAGVAGGAAYHEFACGVDVKDIVPFEKSRRGGPQGGYQARDKHFLHIAADAPGHCGVGVKLVVLGREHYGMYSYRFAGGGVIFYRKLALGVGP